MTSFSLLESWLIREAGFWILTRRKEGDLGERAAPATTEQVETCCRTPGHVCKTSWFPWVPTTLDGGVRLRPTHAHAIRKDRVMLFCKLDDGFSYNSSIIVTGDVVFNSFQFEVRDPIASARHVSRQVKSTTCIARAAHETGREIWTLIFTCAARERISH